MVPRVKFALEGLVPASLRLADERDEEESTKQSQHDQHDVDVPDERAGGLRIDSISSSAAFADIAMLSAGETVIIDAALAAAEHESVLRGALVAQMEALAQPAAARARRTLALRVHEESLSALQAQVFSLAVRAVWWTLQTLR